MNQPRQLDASLQDELRALLGDRLTTSRGVREHHGKDESYYPYAPPDAVVFAHSTEVLIEPDGNLIGTSILSGQ